MNSLIKTKQNQSMLKFLFPFFLICICHCEIRNLQSVYAIQACIGKTQTTPCQFQGVGPTAPINYGQCRASTTGVMTCNTAYLPNSNTDPSSPEDNSDTTLFNVAVQTSAPAQLSNIAFNGFSFMLENDFCSNTFLPPLHCADFFGFQHLRDITPNGQGHNTMFLTYVAANVLNLLDNSTLSKIVSLALSQSADVQKYGSMRYKLVSAFVRNLNGQLPSGKKGLNQDAIKNFSKSLYNLEAPLALQRASLYSEVINSFNSTQIAFLKKLQSTSYIQTWPTFPRVCWVKGLNNLQCTLLNAFAGEIFSWYTGNLETDTYFGPERQFNYFGGLYVKDVMSVGVANFTIPENIGGTLSRGLLGILNDTQSKMIIDLVTNQNASLNSLVEARRNISKIFRNILSGTQSASDPNVVYQIFNLEQYYGTLDGSVSYLYGTAFAQVYKSLNQTQITKMKALLNISGYPCQQTPGFTYMFQWPYASPYYDNAVSIDSSSDEFFI